MTTAQIIAEALRLIAINQAARAALAAAYGLPNPK